MNEIKAFFPERLSEEGLPLAACFDTACAERARAFHSSFPGYAPTPLVPLPALAASLGLAGFFVKDESPRFGLNAFKVLGGSYCLGRLAAEALDVPIEELPFERLTGAEAAKKLGQRTYVTATDGNHGRGIAFAAQQLGQACVVYMPRGASPERLANIRKLGAQATITDLSYDDAVRKAKRDADTYGWALVQDTAWPGYEKVPGWIMEGYTTLALEAAEQLGDAPPTHVFLQAGVGAMAGALAAFFRNRYPGEKAPTILIAEPNKADCIYRTAKAADGALHPVTTEMDTIMAGLACGEPCTIGWRLLSACANGYFSLPDEVAALGMRVLGAPLLGDRRIVSGESGAATTGLVYALMARKELSPLRKKLRLGPESRVLCISTEGATDRESYRRIVWEGAFPCE